MSNDNPIDGINSILKELKQAKNKLQEQAEDTKWYNYVVPNAVRYSDYYQTIVSGLFFRASRKGESLIDYRYSERSMAIDTFVNSLSDIGFKKIYSCYGDCEIFTSADGVVNISHTLLPDGCEINAASVNKSELEKIDKLVAQCSNEPVEASTA